MRRAAEYALARVRRHHRGGLRPCWAAAGARLRTVWPQRRALRRAPRSRRRGERGRDALRRAERARGPHRRTRGRAPHRHPRPRLGVGGRARGRRHRHADRRAPQPRPGRGRPGDRRDRRQPARRPAPGAAQHRLSRCHRGGGAADRAARCGRRRRLLPRAHRRGQGARGARHAAPDRRGAVAACARTLRQALPQPHPRGDLPRAGGSRAGQALHQRLALREVRRRQPVLHDGERLRPRLRAHPRGGDAQLPACRRPARRRLRRGTVPVQGHDAAGGVQHQQLRPRARRASPSTKGCRSTWWRASSGASTSRA